MRGEQNLRFIPELGISGLDSLLKDYLVGRDEDRLLPKARIIEIVYLGVVTNYSLFRTEGASTIDTVELPSKGVSTPVIMPQKITAITRRRLTELLRKYSMAKGNKDQIEDFVRRAIKLGYVKAFQHIGISADELPKGQQLEKLMSIEIDESNIILQFKNNSKKEFQISSDKIEWNCWIQPPIQQGTDLGMDTYCPACVLFGAVLTDADNLFMRASGGSLNIGIKSRVVVDPAFSLYPRYEFKTHQKVGEGTLSTTGMSLYKEPHVIPASLVVGKIALHDVTEAELLAVLISLVSAKRYGGRQTRYGGLEIYPVAISAGAYEKISALELAEQLASENKKPLNDAISETLKYLNNKFVSLVTNTGNGYKHTFREALLQYLDDTDKFKQLFKELWEDALSFDKSLVERVLWLKSQK